MIRILHHAADGSVQVQAVILLNKINGFAHDGLNQFRGFLLTLETEDGCINASQTGAGDQHPFGSDFIKGDTEDNAGKIQILQFITLVKEHIGVVIDKQRNHTITLCIGGDTGGDITLAGDSGVLGVLQNQTHRIAALGVFIFFLVGLRLAKSQLDVGQQFLFRGVV